VAAAVRRELQGEFEARCSRLRQELAVAVKEELRADMVARLAGM
jgi:hypothetical protein